MEAQEPKFIYKRFAFLVDTEEISYSKKFDLDKSIKAVTGLQISSNRPNMLFYRGTQRIEINGEEIYPENYESKLLMSGLSVPPDQRFVPVGLVPSGNGEVKINYRDNFDLEVAFTEYQVSIILKCILK